MDNDSFEKVVEKKNTEISTAAGDTYEIEPTPARYVKVRMTYNSANIAGHIVEFEVWGENPNASTAEKKMLIKQLELKQKEIDALRISYSGVVENLENVIKPTGPKDVDGDGVITVSDALVALRMTVGLLEVDLIADVNGDRIVDVADALILLRCSVGLVA